MDTVDCLVIGAGVVGLAIARELAQAGQEVIVCEAETAYGTGVSARNSEVIHAGLYYEPGSLKSRLCIEGKQLLYAYCAERGIAHRRCGKLVVAPDEAGSRKLAAFAERARAQGVTDLQPLSQAEAQALEPALRCHSALLSPSSGLIDSHGLMTALLGDAEAAGALLAVASPVLAARREGEFWRVHTGGAEGMEIGARWLVNAAGLQAQSIAARMTGFPAAAIPRRHLAKGHYFSLAGSAPFQRLIYPLPVDGGLGVHLTLDLGGQARFGPDVEWLSPPQAGTAEMDGADAALNPTPAAESLDFQVDPARAAAFYAAIRRYWPELRDEALQPAYSGIRPKLSGPGEPARDFHIAGPAQHGCAGVLQLFGIESPGLTASLAIARHVRGLMQLT